MKSIFICYDSASETDPSPRGRFALFIKDSISYRNYFHEVNAIQYHIWGE